jgi:hypothetical protein
MTDRELVEANFDLEQGILNCWHLTDDLSELAQDMAEHTITVEQAVEIIRSYSVVYNNRFDRTWRLYEQVCRGLHELRKGATAETALNLDQLQNSLLPKNGKKHSKKVDS